MIQKLNITQKEKRWTKAGRNKKGKKTDVERDKEEAEKTKTEGCTQRLKQGLINMGH